jgi:hypothetical protein
MEGVRFLARRIRSPVRALEPVQNVAPETMPDRNLLRQVNDQDVLHGIAQIRASLSADAVFNARRVAAAPLLH